MQRIISILSPDLVACASFWRGALPKVQVAVNFVDFAAPEEPAEKPVNVRGVKENRAWDTFDARVFFFF